MAVNYESKLLPYQEFNAVEEQEGKKTYWDIQRDRLDDFVKRIKLTDEFQVENLPKNLFLLEKGFGNALKWKNEYNQIEKIIYEDPQPTIDEEINKKLFPFQQRCVQRAIELNGRLLIADEMGIGKTIESLAIASLYKDDLPMLIICPSLLKLNWKDEIMKWLQIPKEEIQLINKSTDPIQKVKVTIISYQMVTKLIDELTDMQFKLGICDEVHYLKGLDSQRSLACVPLLQSCKRLMLLTGTPALAKPQDMFNQLKMLRPDVFRSFLGFANRYCDPKKDWFTKRMIYDGLTRANELNYILKSHLMIRRLKSDVLTELPSKRRFRIKVDIENKDRKLISQIMNQLGMNNIMQYMAGSMTWTQEEKDKYLLLYKRSGLSKVESVIQYLESLITGQDQKVICFAHHLDVIGALVDHFKKKDIKHITIQGQTSQEDRHQQVKDFQTDDTIRLAVLSLTAANVGITLTAASVVVFAEMHWTPANMLQAEDRVHRIGQSKTVECHYLIGDGTLDEVIYRKLESKMNTVSTFLDGQSSSLAAEHIDNRESQNDLEVDWTGLEEMEFDLAKTPIENTVIDDIDAILTEAPQQVTSPVKKSKGSKSKKKL